MRENNKTAVRPAKAQAIRMTDLIDYREGTVVSRDLIRKEAGTVTLFAFDKNEKLGEHVVPCDAVAYIVEGEAEVVISGKAHHLKKDDMLLMPARHPHSLRALKKFKMVLSMIRS